MKIPNILIFLFVEIHYRQLPSAASFGWAFDWKLMEIFSGELLNDALVNSPPRTLAVRPSLPLPITVVLLPTIDGSARLLGSISRKASVRGPPLALVAVTVVMVRLKTQPTCLTYFVVFLKDYGCRWMLNPGWRDLLARRLFGFWAVFTVFSHFRVVASERGLSCLSKNL